MEVGTILSYDEQKGYGFISPEGNGEDVFVHANDFGEQRRLVRPGLRVEFESVASDRGLKAASARLIDPDVPPSVAVRTDITRVAGEDEECDVLAGAVFLSKVTDLLVEQVPSLTGAQISQVRQHLLGFARSHGWIDG
jgi:cold shock CspA family protein